MSYGSFGKQRAKVYEKLEKESKEMNVVDFKKLHIDVYYIVEFWNKKRKGLTYANVIYRWFSLKNSSYP